MTEDQGLIAAMLANCREDLDDRTRELTVLRSQLADLTRQNQRLLAVQADMAREITSLRGQLALMEAAASV